MLVGTETTVIVVELGFTASQQYRVIVSAVGYPNLTIPGQAFMRQFTNAIVIILTGNIIYTWKKVREHLLFYEG